jgi:hypothetical protein
MRKLKSSYNIDPWLHFPPTLLDQVFSPDQSPPQPIWTSFLDFNHISHDEHLKRSRRNPRSASLENEEQSSGGSDDGASESTEQHRGSAKSIPVDDLTDSRGREESDGGDVSSLFASSHVALISGF